jgi:hypothetical protein
MTWSYDATLPTNKDKVRLDIGDIDTNDQLITDEAIARYLTLTGSVERAGARACRAIAATVGQRLTVSASGSGIDADEQYKHFMGLATELDELAATSGVAAYAGGLTRSGKDAATDDTDRIAPAFTKTLFDYPGEAEM